MTTLHEAVKVIADSVEKLAFEMPVPNPYTPRFVMLVIALRSALAQQGEQQPEERIRLTDGEWPIIELGFGKVEVAEGWQGEVPALIFGHNGTGQIGEPTQPDRVHLAGETIAVVTFANVESLDVVAGKLATIRAERFAAATAVQPTCKQDLPVETEQERYVRMCPDIECGRKKRCTRIVGVSCMSRADIAATPASQLQPCRSPYCECPEGKCSHPGCYDARAEPFNFSSTCIGKPQANSDFKLNGTQDVAVATGVFWDEDMTKCPPGAKVQLLSIHGVAVYGIYRGEKFWSAWAPLPRRKSHGTHSN